MKRKLITFWRIINAGLLNFVRNASLAVAAMAVMIVTLTIVLFSYITNATFTNTIAQITNKIDISVYLQDNISPKQTNTFIKEIKQQPYVAKVRYLNKQQALAAYIKQNQNNQLLITAAIETGNPIPATIQIFPSDLNQIQQIKNLLVKPANLSLQTKDSPSYNGDRKQAIDNITHATDVLRKIGVIAVAVFTVICALIIFNTIQMAIFNRRDEITIMRLLGASTNYIRGPFIVESAIYGMLAAVLSIFIIYGAFSAASSTLQASSLGLLDINYANQYFDDHFLILLVSLIGLGIIIGAGSSIIATFRYLKFKTR